MDKIEEWMKRTLGAPAQSKSPEQKSNTPEQNKKAPFKKRKPQRSWFKKDKPAGSTTPANSNAHKSGNSANPRPQNRNNRHRNKKTNNSQEILTVSNAKTGHRRIIAPKKAKQYPILKGKLKIIPLGGLNEVGKNMTALEYEDDIIIIDMGFEFPKDDLLGIDYVIPDISYLEEKKNNIRGVLLTHAHLDHIGGIPYMLPKLDFPPVFGTKLTIGFVKHRLEEFKQEKFADLRVINTDDKVKLGKFLVSFFRVMHSIPDCVGMVFDTPVGKVVTPGDFKFDDYPARNMLPAEMDKITALGNQNILAMLCESTNATKPGHTISEKQIGEALEQIVADTDKRLIVASFSSQVSRIQQVIDACVKSNRKVFISGRSMRNNIEICVDLGYLMIPNGLIQDIKKYDPKKNPDSQTLILTTGSQGEPVAALARMARNDHPNIKIKKGDTIVLSSSPIIGNELSVNTVINQLCIMGAKVINNQMKEIHTSGHAKQDELIEMLKYVKPKYLIPIHGEYYMRQALATLATEFCDIPEENIIMLQNGEIVEAGTDRKLTVSKETIETKYILIDGSGEGQMGSPVIVDRKMMSQNGTIIALIKVNKSSGKMLGEASIITRGFVYMHETDEVIGDIKKIATDAYRNLHQKNPKADRYEVKRYLKQSIDKYTYKQLSRSPLIIPIIIDC
ncbi:ribonuclease J [Candidatus Peregrinibacteria bacterium HGW-Peregrinibacteria-1]|jgi:ribonuclease J|nr:MAG: ribonuclease J [Candidatus Peregrinibacteria bacterium HGW-Peregrinibacteria-1]